VQKATLVVDEYLLEAITLAPSYMAQQPSSALVRTLTS